MLAHSPLQVGIPATGVADQAILAAREANLVGFFALRVETAASMTGLAISVVGGDLFMASHLLVTSPAILFPHPTRAFDRRDAPGAERAPDCGRTGHQQGDGGQTGDDASPAIRDGSSLAWGRCRSSFSAPCPFIAIHSRPPPTR